MTAAVPPFSDARAPAGARRRLLGLGLGTAALAGLSACGFALRQAPNFAFKSIAVIGSSAIITQLRRNLQATSTVQVLPAERAPEADVIFDVLGETREQSVISTNSSGGVRELQLRLVLRYRLRTPAGKELISSAEIRQQRDITYNETNALAKEGESGLLYRDMQNDIAQQLLRQLGAVKSL